ncbi:hypothetical protein ACO2Q3_21790 [Caulobacter sp. KR2-114]|uniref:hypothetical protein n=1 Tax=Caulobacter sp. KR2-114 TaxID=3400912 RepID=UPI003BFEDF50
MRALSIITGAAAAVLVLAAGPAGDLPSRLEGRYTHSFANGLVTGEHFRSTETLVILRTAPDAAWVDAHLEFFNGHECNISGVADARGEALVLKSGDDELSRCTLAIGPGAGKDRGKLVFVADGTGCNYYCGARGSLDGAAFAAASRRPLTPAQRRKIVAGDDYKAALTAHAAGKPAPA